MREVVISGIGMTRFGKWLNRSLKDLAQEAVMAALSDAAIEARALQAAYVGNAVAGLITGQETIRGQVVLRAMGIGGLPVFNVDNACAASSSALHLAWLSVASGMYECVLVLGMEKMTHTDKKRTFAAIASGLDVEQAEADARAHGVGEGAGETRSVFMDYYAGSIRRYMEQYGLTQRQLAEVSSKNHFHGSKNPFAQYRNLMSADQILADVPVVSPLTRAMCSPIADGAGAAVVCSRPFAQRLAHKPVRIAATSLRSAEAEGRADDNVIRRAADAAYEMAGVSPSDVRIAEVHDATASAEVQAYEQLRLCATGEASKLIAERATTLGGRVPVNTSGGLECRGHPVGATGIAQIIELTLQLRGTARGRQVIGSPTVALAQNAGGHLGNENATCAVTILTI
jgi:acetyl-CoA acetyltransferase